MAKMLNAYRGSEAEKIAIRTSNEIIETLTKTRDCSHATRRSDCKTTECEWVDYGPDEKDGKCMINPELYKKNTCFYMVHAGLSFGDVPDEEKFRKAIETVKQCMKLNLQTFESNEYRTDVLQRIATNLGLDVSQLRELGKYFPISKLTDLTIQTVLSSFEQNVERLKLKGLAVPQIVVDLISNQDKYRGSAFELGVGWESVPILTKSLLLAAVIIHVLVMILFPPVAFAGFAVGPILFPSYGVIYCYAAVMVTIFSSMPNQWPHLSRPQKVKQIQWG